jgi:hypothetical protein
MSEIAKAAAVLEKGQGSEGDDVEDDEKDEKKKEDDEGGEDGEGGGAKDTARGVMDSVGGGVYNTQQGAKKQKNVHGNAAAASLPQLLPSQRQSRRDAGRDKRTPATSSQRDSSSSSSSTRIVAMALVADVGARRDRVSQRGGAGGGVRVLHRGEGRYKEQSRNGGNGGHGGHGGNGDNGLRDALEKQAQILAIKVRGCPLSHPVHFEALSSVWCNAAVLDGESLEALPNPRFPVIICSDDAV